MCDPTLIAMTANTASSGILTSAQTKVNTMEAKSIAKFEAAQLETMGILADARANRQERDLRQGMKRAVDSNMAAMAISGLGFGSFDSIAKGQRRDMSQALSDIAANTDIEKMNYKSQSAMAILGGQMEAAAARMSGKMKMNNLIGQYTSDFYEGYTTKKKDGTNYEWKDLDPSSTFKSFFSRVG